MGIVKASGVTVGSTVEVQHFVDGDWTAAAPQIKAASETILFTIEDLAENWTYRLRLRTVLELEPLTFLFAEFTEEPEPELVVPGQNNIFEVDCEGDFEGDLEDDFLNEDSDCDEDLRAT